MLPLLKFLAIWTGIGFLCEEVARRDTENEAMKIAQQSGKPIINIGAKCNPFGDVRCDIEPSCGAIPCDAEDLYQYRDKEFSVALLSHILEHLENPDKALAEAERIADNVVVLTPSPVFPLTWIHPQHKWVLTNDHKIRIRS